MPELEKHSLLNLHDEELLTFHHQHAEIWCIQCNCESLTKQLLSHALIKKQFS